MKKAAFLPLLLLVLLIFLSFKTETHNPAIEAQSWTRETPVMEVLLALGQKKPGHFIPEVDPAQVKRGEGIVKKGYTTAPDGKRSKLQSKHYVCTNCHNIEREDPDLTKADPDARLDYVVKNNIPFLQGTTFWGIVNRETWYNDDYVKKYGSAVDAARDDIRAAIQLCSTGCSQGRWLEDWEVDAIIAYYYSIQMNLGDLDLTDQELNDLKTAAADPSKFDAARSSLKSKYLQKSPATLGEVPESKEEGYAGISGNAERGKMLFSQTCLTCHGPKGASKYLTLDHSRFSMNFFTRHIEEGSRFSLYEIVRHGTHSVPGHKAYMPYYTRERMSDQQVEDLRAYFEQG